ncbi:hypothetical protein P154DRAFT_483433 [Amniculicola lignicola CBS 123094]|uniref:Heterokaryon incompatibility domain-containing protein n=1 Tax=Amniculicola lignicola CBS 123094 TaxID=1392246 RepID=A0A6A5WUI1_9PLEO|nr:hypothetical protein P154DRAFT_483433 [Amniculicola lignicola CBS 123094]
MTVIYQQASSVISWLGEATDDSDEAVNLIQKFGSIARAYLHNEMPDHLTPNQKISYSIHRPYQHWREFLEEYYDFSVNGQNLIAIWKLLGRPYWTRVWMVQELVGGGLLKDSRGVLVCGSASVGMIPFVCLCMLIVSGVALTNGEYPRKGSLVEPGRTFDLMGHPQGFVMWEAAMTCALGQQGNRSLTHLIKATSRLKATDSRDKIYAFVGMAQDKYQSFPVDYSKPLRNVLTDFVKFMVKADGNLDILLGNRFQTKRDEPSWTPELFQPEHGWVPGFAQFRADGGTPLTVDFEEGNDSLRVKGILVGEVKKVIGPEVLPESGIRMYPTDHDDEPSEYTKGILTFAKSLTAPGEQEMFWRTLILNHNYQGTLMGTYPAPADFGQMADVLFFGKPPSQEYIDGSQLNLGLHEFIAPLRKSWERTRWNRCFFTTEDGGMGIGPFCVKPGDIVVVLFGAEMALILREEDSGYKLIGDAYVHGIMHGELVGKRDPQLFTLR